MSNAKTLKLYGALCNVAYALGLAWYPLEHPFQAAKTAPRKVTPAYKIYCVYVILHSCFTVTCQLCSLLFEDLTQTKLIVAIQFGFGDATVIGKQVMMLTNGRIIYEIVEDIVFRLPAVYNNDVLTVNAATSSILLSTVMSTFTVLSITFLWIDDLIDFLKDTSRRYNPWPLHLPLGDGFWMTIAYYVLPNIGFFFIVSTFLVIDCLVVSTLINLAMRFRQIRHYLANLDRICLEKMRTVNVVDTPQLAYNELYKTVYRDELLTIIKLHDATLKCAAKVQKAFSVGFLMQLLQSLSMLMPCLAKVLIDRSLTSYVLGSTLVFTLMCSLGTYTMNAGNVTSEAAKVSDSIYAANWYRYPELKPYVLVFLAQAQRPLIFYCGGFIEVSHQTFLSIWRASYSVFAIIF